ncbi:hypothetical protein THIOM_000889 [Candidatus Thiomargarita nelsonii]|uniref:Uncharacterized protein n=1 Tax=Candidatus Thiomargarita nelsonii TaxID=1003181 RepID=A0A176S5E0_9GAMM|nr:hypothetical protein THIOM_000889 [Candidatus Thiomargarita nelsonii]
MIAQPIEEIPLSEDEAEKRLAAIFQSWESLEQSVTIAPDKDGFTVNGQQFLDSDGKIVKYVANYKTGDVTYLLETGSDEYLIKSSRVPQEPITIATGTQSGNILSIQTDNGEQYQGLDVILLSRGFLIVGRNSVDRYLAGKGFSNFGVPGAGFHIASYQNGDISSTDYILLEKTKNWTDYSENPADMLKQTIDLTKDTCSLLGLCVKEDYMLVNLKTGKVHPFDISIGGKDISVGSNCRRQNAAVQKCQDMDFFESLYERNGVPNYPHYFWRIRWFNTPSGVIVIAQENESHDVTLTNLTTGQKVVAFNSFFGFNSFKVVQDASGKITVAVDMSPVKLNRFSQQIHINDEKIDDVAEYISLNSTLKTDGIEK